MSRIRYGGGKGTKSSTAASIFQPLILYKRWASVKKELETRHQRALCDLPWRKYFTCHPLSRAKEFYQVFIEIIWEKCVYFPSCKHPTKHSSHTRQQSPIEYGARGITIDAFVSILLEMLDTAEKVSVSHRRCLPRDKKKSVHQSIFTPFTHSTRL